MGPELEFVLIILFLFVLPIVFMGMWMEHKKSMAKMKVELDDTEKQGLKDELSGVKKRLEVLEAIVTDKKYELGQEINKLRSVE